LHRRERKYTYVFFVTAVPLFLAGIAAAYALLPKTFAILLSFTPEQADNLVSLDEYLSFMIRFLLVFGAAFELPVILILLNLVGVLSARKLRSWWRPSVFLIFVFSAVATPTPDPFSMIVLAVPMILLFAVAVAITTLVDRRRLARSGEPDYDALADDEISPLDERPSALDETPSALDDTPSPLDERPSPIDRPTRIDDLP
jgi:sec-independent protein translocase protein TatC